MKNCTATEEELQECNGDCRTCEYDVDYEGEDWLRCEECDCEDLEYYIENKKYKCTNCNFIGDI